MTLSLLSLNVWGGRLAPMVLDYLAAVDADIFCLQEVVHSPGAGKPWLSYRDGGIDLPQRANLLAEIRARFPGHHLVFAPVARGLLFDGDRPVPSEFGLATLVRDTLAVIRQDIAFIHGAFSPDGWGAHPRPRNAHGFRIYDPAADRYLSAVQWHGLRDPEGKHDTPARLAQGQAVAHQIRTLWPPGEGLVVCGDFNILPGSSTFGLMDEFGLSDLVTGRGFTDTRTSHYTKPQRHADYMLVNDYVDVAQFDVVETPEVSDHRALYLRIA